MADVLTPHNGGLICRGIVAVIREPEWSGDRSCIKWAFDIDYTKRICPENLTWYWFDIERLLMCMAASFICIIVDMGRWSQQRMPNSGVTNGNQMLTAI